MRLWVPLTSVPGWRGLGLSETRHERVTTVLRTYHPTCYQCSPTLLLSVSSTQYLVDMSAIIQRSPASRVFKDNASAPSTQIASQSLTTTNARKNTNTTKFERLVPDLDTLKTSLRVLSTVASACPGPVKEVAEKLLEIVEAAEVSLSYDLICPCEH